MSENWDSTVLEDARDETAFLDLHAWKEPDVDALTGAGYPLFDFTKHNVSHDDVKWPNRLGDWNIRLVNTSGVTTMGQLVATPTGARTRKIYIAGKKKEIAREVEADPAVIERYIDLSKRQRFSMDPPVYIWVLSHYGKMTEEEYRRIRTATNSFTMARKCGYPAMMSWPRLTAALNMMAIMMRINP